MPIRLKGGVEFLQAIVMHSVSKTLACAPVSLAVPQPSCVVSTALQRATRHAEMAENGTIS